MFKFSCDCDDCRRVRGWLADGLIIILTSAVIWLVAACVGIR